MTVIVVEGFDVYPDINATSQGLQARWLGVDGGQGAGYAGLSLQSGRFAGQSLRINGNSISNRAGYPLAAQGSGPSSYVVGMAVQLGTSTTNATCFETVFEGPTGTVNVGVGVNTSQQLYVYKAKSGQIGTPIATSLIAISTGSWHYVELIVVSGTSISLYLDGVQIITYSGTTGAASFDALVLGSYATPANSAQFYFDDLYVTNTATRLGERRVSTLYPASNGAVGWTPLTSTNYVEVSETLCDGDTSYVSTSTAGASDLYNITSLPSTPITIDAVQVRCAVRKSDSSSHILNTQIESGGTTTTGAAFAIASTYLYDCDLYPTNPATGLAWTATAVNSAQIGQKLVS